MHFIVIEKLQVVKDFANFFEKKFQTIHSNLFTRTHAHNVHKPQNVRTVQTSGGPNRPK